MFILDMQSMCLELTVWVDGGSALMHGHWRVAHRIAVIRQVSSLGSTHCICPNPFRIRLAPQLPAWAPQTNARQPQSACIATRLSTVCCSHSGQHACQMQACCMLLPIMACGPPRSLMTAICKVCGQGVRELHLRLQLRILVAVLLPCACKHCAGRLTAWQALAALANSRSLLVPRGMLCCQNTR